MFEGGFLKLVFLELVEDEMVRRVYLGQNFELRKEIEF
jgi:lipopolysaccharide export system ATP-binding protein